MCVDDGEGPRKVDAKARIEADGVYGKEWDFVRETVAFDESEVGRSDWVRV